MVVSFFGTYTPKRNFGFTLGTTWVQKVLAGYLTPVMLPSYAVWRAGKIVVAREFKATL